MPIRIAEYVLKANEFIHDVARQLNDAENFDRASRVTAAVFHGLRDTLTPDESLHLISQLPLYIKAVYIDEWKKAAEPAASNFLNQLCSYGRQLAEQDFNNESQARVSTKAVLNAMKKYASHNEIDHVTKRLEIGDLQSVSAK